MRWSLFLALLVVAMPVSAQQKVVAPLDVPMSFSGTYGELRHNHFHGGCDWRVGGKTGDPIHAIKDGYVSRLSVSNGGYGNAVYITHPDGTLSVYGHMMEFAPGLKSIVREEQYAKRSHSVYMFLDKDRYPVKAGDVIGKVGSTGASAGPHLHLELRDASNDNTLNYIARGYYKVTDNMKPVFRKVNFYAFSDSTGIPVSARVCSLSSPSGRWKDTLALPGRFYAGIDAIDKQEGTDARLAVEEYRAYIDDNLFFIVNLRDVAREEDLYIQSLIQYEESCGGGADVVKTQVDPGNLMANGRIRSVDGGVVTLRDDAPHVIRLEAEDEHGNVAKCSFVVRRSKSVGASAIALAESAANGKDTEVMLWYMPSRIIDEGFSFSLPLGSLYRNVAVDLKKVGGPDVKAGIYSNIWRVGSNEIPLHGRGRIAIECDVPIYLIDKSFIASYKNGTLSYAGGLWRDSVLLNEDMFEIGTSRYMVGDVKFGTYCVAVDDTAPTVSFVENKGNILQGKDRITLRVKDNLSGISGADVYIDGEWVLSQCIGGKVIVVLDSEHTSKGGSHTFEAIVRDNCGNKAFVKRKFNW